MYYDDHFHPNAPDYEDAMSYDSQNNYDLNNDDNESNISSLNTIIKQQRKIIDAYKLSDPYYHKISFYNEKRRSYSVEIYTTPNAIGAPIRNAVTGVRYPNHLVGSKHEYLFFKTKLATGQIGRESATLFFDTPEQCERHMRQGTVDANVKTRWLSKCIETERQLDM